MIRTLKTIGLAAMAAMALGAFASAASAQELGVFTAGTDTGHETTHLTGDQVGNDEDNYFKIPGFEEVTCPNAGVSYTGTVEGGTATEITVAPHYSNCKAFGGAFTAHVDMTGCDYRFLQPESVGEDEYTGETDLACPEGKHVDIEVTTFLGNCDFTVFPKDGLGEVTYTVSTGNPHDVKIDANVTEIPWTLDPTAGICSTHDEGENAEFVSTVTVTGYEDEAHEIRNDVWISNEE